MDDDMKLILVRLAFHERRNGSHKNADALTP
jgi:hypothetical protein